MNFLDLKRACQIILVAALVLVFLPALAEEKKPSDDKVAAVNGVVITQEEYNRELNIHLERFSQQGRPLSDAQLVQLKNDILNRIIEVEVLYQESRKVGIQITDQAVEDHLAAVKKRFPDENSFKEAVSRMNLTEDDVKRQIREGLAIKELIDQQVTRNIAVTEAESKAYYDSHPEMFRQPAQVKASHILIKVDAGASDAQKSEARKKIERVQQKLKDGEDFAELAKANSEGPSNVRGGDLGYFRRGQMVKPFEDAAFALEPNQVSDIVETRFGYHLIKVYDKQPEKTLAYAEVKERLTERMKQQKIEKDAGEYINKLKSNAKIEKYL